MVKGHPRINFWASGIKKQDATRALTHPDHPLATLSSSLLRYPTGCGGGPWSWGSTPRAAPLFHRHIAGSCLGWASSMLGQFGMTI
jgi:hypothetical protein